MNSYRKPKKVEVVFFSGTGSTRIVAEQFVTSFTQNNIIASSHELRHDNQFTFQKADMLVVIYPVYAVNAPKPIYRFIESLSSTMKCPAVVISVSGGGEVSPNTACRSHCIKRLHKKGYPVVYEKMIVMPSNFVLPTPEELSVRLLEILPQKVNSIIKDLQSGIIRRTRRHIIDIFFSFIGELEKRKVVGYTFGRCIKVNPNCNGCGICQNGCPNGNIKISNKKPIFDGKCVLCLNCFYHCPQKALKPGVGSFMVLKDGYPMKKWKNEMLGKKQYSIEELAKGYAYSGIKKYLMEDMD